MDWKVLIAGGSIVGKAACMHVHGTKNTSTGVLVMGRKYHCTCLLVTRRRVWSEVSKVRLTRIAEEQSREASEKQYRRACTQCLFSLPAKTFQQLTTCVWYLFQGASLFCMCLHTRCGISCHPKESALSARGRIYLYKLGHLAETGSHGAHQVDWCIYTYIIELTRSSMSPSK